MTEQIAWVVSTGRYGGNEDPFLHVRVLCPLCGLIHTHGGNTLWDPSLGSRVGHCGNSRPNEDEIGYELAWPDDKGAKLLNTHMDHCHTLIQTRGDSLCMRPVSLHNGAGFYCKMHSHGKKPDTRRAIDTSSIKISPQESVFTPKFVINPEAGYLYNPVSQAEIDQWDARRNAVVMV